MLMNNVLKPCFCLLITMVFACEATQVNCPTDETMDGDLDDSSCETCDGDDFEREIIEEDSGSEPRVRIGNDCRNNLCFSVAPTGQHTCFDNEKKISCPGEPGSEACANTPFCGQDAQYAIGIENRFQMQMAGEAEVVVDAITGLMWSKSTNTERWDKSNGICTLKQTDSYSDWRLPNIHELSTLADHDETDLMTYDVFQTLEERWAYYFWSSNYTNGMIFSPRGIDFHTGKTMTPQIFDGLPCDHYEYPLHSRCVRGGPAVISGARFVTVDAVQGEPILRDESSFLDWQADFPSDVMNWADALSYCEGLDYGGHRDWRLPNLNEGVSLMNFDPDLESASSHQMPFDIEESLTLVTSTTDMQAFDQAWIVTLGNAYSYSSNRKDGLYSVICVRGKTN